MHASKRLIVYPGWPVRALLIMIGLAGWFTTQYAIIGARPPLGGDVTAAGSVVTAGDWLLTMAAPLNAAMHAHPEWVNALLIVSSAIIDVLGIFIFLKTIRGPTLRPFIGLFILFTLRQLSQVLVALPPPEGMIWHSPGVPSFLVTYGVGNDFFFSGHTALAVYGAIELARSPWKSLLGIGLLIVLLEISTVIILRTHYTMDVVGGVAVAILAACAASRVSPWIDNAFRYR